MKLIYISGYYKPAYVYGGPVRCVSEMCEGLVKLGIEVTVFTTNANGARQLEVPTSQEVDVDGVKVWYFPLSMIGKFFYSPLMARAIHQQVRNFDHVVIDSMWGYPFHPAFSTCRQFARPYVVPLHGQLQPWAYQQGLIKKKIYIEFFLRKYLNSAAALHCTDDSEVESARRLGITSPAFVIPYGIDTSKFCALPPRGQFRKRLGISDDAQVLLFIGRLARIKRVDIAIEALARAISAGIYAVLVVAGPDEEGLIKNFKNQAKMLGCDSNVFFTGLLGSEEVLSAYADADIFLMPSEIQENFGMSALEAMAAGLPILVSEGIPVGRYAEKAGAGKVLPCTSEAFSKAVVELLSSPHDLKRMGDCGKDLAMNRFDTSIVVNDMLQQYAAILKSRLPFPLSI